MFSGDVAHLSVRLALVNHRQHAVVGSDELGARSGHEDRAPRAAHAGIDDHQVNGAGREEAVTLGQGEGAVKDVVGIDLMADINQYGVGVDP